LNKRKPVVIPEYFAERFGIKEEKYFEKIKRINLKKDEKVLNEANYKIMKRDIDINNHVNNSIYAELLFESLPEIYSEIKFSEININYMKELVLGDRVVIDVYLEKDEFYFFFRNEDSSEMYARIWANVN
jgi:acyl-acyl carrier protein thioesterase